MTIKRIVSFLLVACLLLACLPGVALADEITDFKLMDVKETADAENNVIVKVPFVTNIDFNFLTIQATFSSESQYVTLTGFEHADQIKISANDEEYIDSDNVGHVLWIEPNYDGLSLAAGDTVWTAVFTVSKDAPKDTPLPVTLEVQAMASADGSVSVIDTAYNATITVEEPSAPPAEAEDYEIWYTLDKKADTEETPDGYKELKVGDTVTATVYLKNNSEETYLQAYDVYLTHSKHLTPGAADENSVFDLFIGDADTADAVKEAHIQFAADNSNAQEINQGDVVELGTIEFVVSGSAVFGEGMDITIVQGSEEDGQETTNIAVGKVFAADADVSEYGSVGDKKSYYPDVINTVKEIVGEVETDVTYNGVEITDVYTVKYDANGGEGAPSNETKGHNVAHTLNTTTEPTREGHAFLGWSTDKDATTEDACITVLDADVNNEPITVYAVWAPNTFTITYKVDGETYEEQSYSYDAEVTAPTAPSKTGYTFDGWDPALPATMPAENLEVSAQWTVNKYTITYMVDGEQYGEKQEYEFGAAVTAPTAPSKEGYTFDGWDPALPATMPAENLEVSAQWTVNKYTITYMVDGEQYGEKQEYEFGADVTAPENPSKDGYDFAGWDANIPETMPAENLVITAKWNPVTYTIEFDLNGGGFEGELPESFNKETQTMTYTIEDDVTLPNAVLGGKNFGGWQVTTNGGNWNNPSYKDTVGTGKYGSVVLTANWTDKDFKITEATVENGTVTAENADGVSLKTANKGETINVTVDSAGGYTLVAGSVKYMEANGATGDIAVEKQDDGTYTGSFEMPEGNVTVTAEFEGIEYTIQFNGNGGEGSAEEITVKYGEEAKLPIEGFTREGYEFKGWNTAADGNGTPYTIVDDKITAKNVMVPTEGGENTVTLYAVWEAIPYTVTIADGIEHGGVEVKSATEELKYFIGDTVTLSITPDEGYELDELTVVETKSGDEVTVTDNQFTMPAADVTVNATFKKTDYTLTIEADSERGSVTTDAENNKAQMGNTVTVTVTPNEGYELDTLTVEKTEGGEKVDVNNNQFTMPAADVTIKATFKLKDLDVTVSDEIDVEKGSVTTDATDNKAQMGDTITLTITPKPGYELDELTVTDANGEVVDVNEENNTFEMPSTGVTIHATFTAKPYTITFQLDGGAMPADDSWTGDATYNEADSTLTYTIESTAKLPLPTKAGYQFEGWFVVNEADNEANVGEWGKHDTKHEADSAVAGHYENIVLLAKWTQAANYTVEQYGYSNEVGLYLLIVPNDLTDGEDGTVYEYQFDGKPMYFIQDANYGDATTGVFYLLIDEKYVDGDKLTEDGYKLLTSGLAADNKRSEVKYTGDINADGMLNIADANVVYQMIVTGDAYYAIDQVTDYDRLHADMEKVNPEGYFRATLEDVHKIVNMINGTTD